MATRNYLNTVDPTSLSAPLNNSSVTVNVASTAGFPAVPFVGAIDRGTPDEEIVLVSAKTGTTFTVTRGFDGTASVAHLSGAAFEHCTAAIEYREANAHINDGGRDDHTQYFNLDRAKLYFPQGFNASSPGSISSITTTNQQCNTLTIPSATFARKAMFFGSAEGQSLTTQQINYWFTIRLVSDGTAIPGGAATSIGQSSAMFNVTTRWVNIPAGSAFVVGSYIRRQTGSGGTISGDTNLNSLSALVIPNV